MMQEIVEEVFGPLDTVFCKSPLVVFQRSRSCYCYGGSYNERPPPENIVIEASNRDVGVTVADIYNVFADWESPCAHCFLEDVEHLQCNMYRLFFGS